jgi:hypothetical protein
VEDCSRWGRFLRASEVDKITNQTHFLMTTTQPQLAVAYTAPGQNANNEPMLNVLGMAVGVKIRYD